MNRIAFFPVCEVYPRGSYRVINDIGQHAVYGSRMPAARNHPFAWRNASEAEAWLAWHPSWASWSGPNLTVCGGGKPNMFAPDASPATVPAKAYKPTHGGYSGTVTGRIPSRAPAYYDTDALYAELLALSKKFATPKPPPYSLHWDGSVYTVRNRAGETAGCCEGGRKPYPRQWLKEQWAKDFIRDLGRRRAPIDMIWLAAKANEPLVWPVIPVVDDGSNEEASTVPDYVVWTAVLTNSPSTDLGKMLSARIQFPNL